LSILFTALLFTACTKSNQNYNCSSVLPQKLDTVKIQPSMKGWELYSWAGNEQSCDNWNYTILPGTNRIKSYSEVTNDSVLLKVIGKEQLKSLLSKFPKKENILWIGENWLSRIWG
jgi:hypothetical protein